MCPIYISKQDLPFSFMYVSFYICATILITTSHTVIT